MNANGARTESNNFLIDSSTVSSSQRSGVVNINPNTESVQEVRVAVNNFSAEYGRNGSVLVNIITKSGTNDLHGERRLLLHEQRRCRRRTTSRSRPPGSAPRLRRKEFSWGVGGPIVQGPHVLLHVGRRAAVGRRDQPAPRRSSRRTSRGSCSRTGRTTSRPTSLNNFPASFTPGSQLPHGRPARSASAARAATPIASPVGPIPCNLPVSGDGTWNETSPRNGLQWTARVDHHFNEGRDRLYGSFNRTTTDKVGFGEPSVYPGVHRAVADQQHALQHQLDEDRLADDGQRGVVLVGAALGRADQPASRHPRHHDHRRRRLSAGGFGPNEFVQNSFEWRDVVTWTRGSHSLKIGGAYTREHADNDSSRTYNRPHLRVQQRLRLRRRSAVQPDATSRSIRRPAARSPSSRASTAPSRSRRSSRTTGRCKPNLTREPRPALRGLPQHLRRVRRHGQHRVHDRRRRPRARGSPSARIVERHYYLEGGLWSGGMHTIAPRASFAWDPDERRADVDSRRLRPLVRAHVEPDLGLRAPQPAGVRDRRRRRSTTSAKPVFGLGADAEVAVRLPAPDRPHRRPQPAGRSAERPLRSCTSSTRTSTRCISTTGSSACSAPSERVAVEADYIGSRGGNGYRKYDINRFNGDLFDGRYDGIIPGFSNINYTESTDESRYHGAHVRRPHQPRRPAARRRLHDRQGHRLLELVLGRRAARRLRPGRSGRGSGRLRRPAEVGVLGEAGSCPARRRARSRRSQADGRCRAS